MPKGEAGWDDRSVARNVPCNPRQAPSPRDVRACKLLWIHEDHQETWPCHRLCDAEEIYAKEGERGSVFKFYSVRCNGLNSWLASGTRFESWRISTSSSLNASPTWRRSLPSSEATMWRKWTTRWSKSTERQKVASLLLCLFTQTRH